jgi:hypothetical protein
MFSGQGPVGFLTPENPGRLSDICPEKFPQWFSEDFWRQ